MSPRESRQAWRSRMAAVERGIDAGLAEQKAERDAAWKRASEVRRAAETARVRYGA